MFSLIKKIVFPGSVHRTVSGAVTVSSTWTVESKRGSLEEWPVPGLGQGVFSLNLKHCVLESREVTKDCWGPAKKQEPARRDCHWPKGTV